MASISTDPNGRRTVQFVGPDGKRRSVRLGKVPMKTAEEVRRRVEYLLAAKVSGTAPDGDTMKWLASVGGGLHARLAAAGLVAPREAPARASLGGWVETYLAGRTDIKPRTRINLQACAARLVEFFGADTALGDITPGDADQWLIWLRDRYAAGTAGRTVKRAKQLFRAAVRKRLLAQNPFEDVRPPSQVNEGRKFFVDRQTASRVLDACPDAEWRLLFALSRFGGLRCPSEHLTLTWPDVDWGRNRFLVHAPKTEHHEGKGERWVPIFPELRPHLEEAFELAPEGAVYVVTRHRDGNANLRTQLTRIIRRAGLTPWPKLFHNLRASAETELAAAYPLHVVCAWLGNSTLIAQKHYLQITDEDFRRGAEFGAGAVQNPVQQAAAPNGTDSQEGAQPLAGCKAVRRDANICESDEYPRQDSNLR